MKASIRKELLAHVVDTLSSSLAYDEECEFDDLHLTCFNEDYYIIGYYTGEQWLKGHELSPFEAIADVIDYHENLYGVVNIKARDINSEWVVNQLVYFYGEELLSDYDLEQSASELLAELSSELKGY
jgi:hypothetical protein